MSRDHYIAQTYLNRFVGKNGFLQAYRKSDGNTFPCRPYAICHEWDGDMIPDFMVQPDYLGQYRAMFEQNWGLAVDAIEAQACPDDVKLAIAGYWGNLLVCTPAWKRVGVSIYYRQMMDFLNAHRDLKNRIGKPDKIINEALAAIDAGKVKLEIDPNYIHAVSASQMLEHAIRLYNSDWIIVANDTDIDFLTSDNPSAIEDPGQFRGGVGGLTRYLPITPRLCIVCEPMHPEIMRGKFELTDPPKGRVRFATTSKDHIKEINRVIVKCAEDLVLSSEKLASVEALAKKYAKFRMVSDFYKMRLPDGHLGISHTRVREAA
jgi:hypothetical protein